MVLIPRNIAPQNKCYYYISPIKIHSFYYYLCFNPYSNTGIELSRASMKRLRNTYECWKTFDYRPKLLKEIQ